MIFAMKHMKPSYLNMFSEPLQEFLNKQGGISSSGTASSSLFDLPIL